MARKPRVAVEAPVKPVEREESVPAPNPHLVTNTTPGSRLWLSGGRVLAYGESGICEETAAILRERGNG